MIYMLYYCRKEALMSVSCDEDGVDTVPSGGPGSEGTVFLSLPGDHPPVCPGKLKCISYASPTKHQRRGSSEIPGKQSLNSHSAYLLRAHSEPDIVLKVVKRTEIPSCQELAWRLASSQNRALKLPGQEAATQIRPSAISKKPLGDQAEVADPETGVGGAVGG